MRIEYHRTLIADRVRNDAFHRALAKSIVKGKTVVADIGAGTGLLGLMAAKLGAREVFLYETAEVAAVAAAHLKANRAKACHIIPCHSTEMQDPPRVDLIVSETLGNYALEEDIIETLNDAHARFLKPGATVIPARITQVVAPVISGRIAKELTAWDSVGFDLDLSIARTMSLNNAYVRTLKPAELLDGGTTAKVWDTVDLTCPAKADRKGEAAWKLDAATPVHGFAAWWIAELVEGVTLSTAPGAPATHWEQLYFPLLRPLDGKSGDTIAITLRSRSSIEGGTHLAWTATHTAKSGKQVDRQALDLDKGWLP
ncbi:MAG: 50S ribosomal protein L11 methyltransferase [Hyphomicrobiaceae bacterium]|nr:50S ribosomal protein L11 methyltransferase [Hyphomicrobiaceae bacterium]